MSYYRHPPHRAYGSSGGLAMPSMTPVVRAIIIASVAVWAVQFVLGVVLGVVGMEKLFGIMPSYVAQGAIWQPVTYMFLHSTGSLSHILLNMLILWMMGCDLERHWGSRRFLIYYLVCGVGAGVFVTVGGLLAGSVIPTIGASGAIYGVLLAFGLIFGDRVVLFMFVFPMKARTLCIILFFIAFVFTWSPRGGGVSHIAHLGGMVVGYLYLKRAWRLGEFYRELRWKLRRRRFRVMPPKDEDRWIH